jgi:hypothetical protein
MPNQVEDFMALYKAGKYKEALAMIEAEKVKAKYPPDTIVSEDGKPPKFTKKGQACRTGRRWDMASQAASWKADSHAQARA